MKHQEYELTVSKSCVKKIGHCLFYNKSSNHSTDVKQQIIPSYNYKHEIIPSFDEISLKLKGKH